MASSSDEGGDSSTSADSPPSAGLWRGALAYPNYRLFLFGQTVSNLGTWIQSTALQWLVYAVLTDSAARLGQFHFLAQLPILLLGLLSGAVAETVNRHRIILWTQSLMMLYAGVLAVLTLVQTPDGRPIITIWQIFILALFAGIVQAFDLPARQAFLLQMVPKRDLPNAVALNSLTFNLTRIVGPSLAGLMIFAVKHAEPGRLALGEGICFLLNAVSFLAVLISLARMRGLPEPEPRKAGKRLDFLMEGIHYVRRMPHLLALHIYVGIAAIFAIPYLMLTPVYAKTVLAGNAAVYGYLNASIGAGAILGGTIMVRRNRVRGLGKVITVSTAGFAASTLLLALNDYGLVAACLLFGLAGLSMVSAMISAQTLVQTLVAEEVRGRVISLYTMVNVGLMPFGSLLSGYLSEHHGVRWTLAINAVACLLTVLYFGLRLPRLRLAAQATAEYQTAVSVER